MIKDDGNCTGAELLRKYREYNVESFFLERKLIDEIENFFVERFNSPLFALDIYLNDSGKWIVINEYSNYGHITPAMVEEFCKEYKVTLDHITEEQIVDSEGNKSKGNVKYLFEIIK